MCLQNFIKVPHHDQNQRLLFGIVTERQPRVLALVCCLACPPLTLASLLPLAASYHWQPPTPASLLPLPASYPCQPPTPAILLPLTSSNPCLCLPWSLICKHYLERCFSCLYYWWSSCPTVIPGHRSPSLSGSAYTVVVLNIKWFLLYKWNFLISLWFGLKLFQSSFTECSSNIDWYHICKSSNFTNL